MKLEDELEDKVERISSRADLANFVSALAHDLRTYQDEWENPTLERFLDALASWTEDMDGYFKNKGESTPEQPDWRLLGQMLLAAKFYE